MTNQPKLKQRIVRRVPLVAAVIGMVLILGSIVFFFETDQGRIVGATGGMFMLLGAVWYAAHPFLKNRRTYLALRSEVDEFIKLVRGLNDAAVANQLDEIERTRTAMHKYVDRVVSAAGESE